jgi:hypothetical protein
MIFVKDGVMRIKLFPHVTPEKFQYFVKCGYAGAKY